MNTLLRPEVRALPVSSFTNVLDTKFKKEFSGNAENFELFDKQIKSINTENTGVFLTVDTHPEKQTGKKKGIPGTALVTISATPGTDKRTLHKLLQFNV